MYALEPDTEHLEALRRHATDAMSFQALKAATTWWIDAPPPQGTGARLGYTPAGRSWVAIGSPLVDHSQRAEAVRRFCRAARLAGRRPVFFGVEDARPFERCRTLPLGLQSVLKPSEWSATLRRRPKLREQLRRARAKGVTVRAVEVDELAPQSPLRRAVARLRDEWLRSRAMEPMAFVVDVQPFYAAAEHLYFVAERGGVPVQFLSAVPIHGNHGWLMEDMLRGDDAPNGTTELVIDALMRRLTSDSHWVTPGLTPLTGDIPRWLRFVRATSVALYDFSGLRLFRQRLQPAEWRPVWLAWDRGPALGALIDVLRAFAGGRILPFAFRSLVRHPNGPPWAVAVPLVAWTVLLAVMAALGDHETLGFSLGSLRAWVLFDAALAWLLFTVARRPRARRLAATAAIAGFDAVVSVRHLSVVGLGGDVLSGTLRVIATAGPLIGTAALGWAAWRAHRRATSHSIR